MEFLVKFVDFPVETKHFSPFHKVQNRLLVLASNNFHGRKCGEGSGRKPDNITHGGTNKQKI